VDGETEITGADRAAFTVTETAFEVTVTRLLSVTLSSKYQVPVVDKAPVNVELGEVQYSEELPKLL
jgi:hypothetical protein